jgi:hypothetical protein
MQQTREADLHAPTGTRNYWLPEAIDYTQGSDHDVFIGLGVPASMFGHDPDWTHHTSEDTLDKTDASEFRRVGTMAGAAVWWIAAAEPNPQLATSMTGFSQSERSMRKELRTQFTAKPSTAEQSRASDGTGPRRLTLLPIYSDAVEAISGEDRKWWDAQDARFASSSEGLATEPNLELIAFEAMNFMNGKRSTNDIAALLSAEYLIDIDQAWVDRVLSIFAKQGLVARE